MGGATENTLLTVAGLKASGAYDATVIAGPANKEEGALLDEAASYGVEVQIVPSLQRDMHAIADLRALVELTRLCAEGEYSIVHTHSSKAGVLGRLAGRLAGVPVVTHTFHGPPFGTDTPALQKAVYVLAERFAGRLSTGILSVTHDLIRKMSAVGAAVPEKCAVARSGMDLDRFLHPEPGREELRARWGVEPGDVAMGTIGRVHTGKGQDVLVGLAPRLCEMIPALRMVIIGTGPLKEPLEQQVRAQGLGDRVLFVGGVPVEEMPETISALDMLVHASQREGLARVIVQSLAAGKPVISYDLDGSPEVITDRVNGRLVPPDDLDALVDAIAELAGDADLRAAWGAMGPPAVDPPFRAEAMVRTIAAEYAKLLAQKGIAAPENVTIPPLHTWASSRTG